MDDLRMPSAYVYVPTRISNNTAPANPVWITIEAERILYVDRGRNVILCDRLPGAGTLVLQLTTEQVATALKQMAN